MSGINQSADLCRLIELEGELASLTADEKDSCKQPIWVKIGDFLVSRSHHPVTVNRKKYLTLALTCGWLCGAHRWYAGDKIWAILYLLTFWTGIAAAMTIVDVFLLLVRYEPDENGMITI